MIIINANIIIKILITTSHYRFICHTYSIMYTAIVYQSENQGNEKTYYDLASNDDARVFLKPYIEGADEINEDYILYGGGSATVRIIMTSNRVPTNMVNWLTEDQFTSKFRNDFEDEDESAARD